MNVANLKQRECFKPFTTGSALNSQIYKTFFFLAKDKLFKSILDQSISIESAIFCSVNLISVQLQIKRGNLYFDFYGQRDSFFFLLLYRIRKILKRIFFQLQTTTWKRAASPRGPRTSAGGRYTNTYWSLGDIIDLYG